MVRRLLIFLLLLIGPLSVFSQFRWDFGGGLGVANNLGEMGGKELTRRDFIADLKLKETRWALNGFARFKLHPNVSVKGILTYARLEGADSLSSNPGRAGRNLHFRNDIFELSATAEFYFYEVNDIGRSYRFRNDLRVYAFAGVGGLYSNPKAKYQGSWIALRPLRTEGQTKEYSQFLIEIPAGIGMYFTIKKQHRIGWELGWRTLFSDYLDDVSTVYADPSVLPNQTSIDLANQSSMSLYLSNPELGYAHPNNYLPGMKRGDPTHNDSYLITTFNYSYVVRGRSKFSKSRYSSYFKSKRYKKRKVRAKF